MSELKETAPRTLDDVPAVLTEIENALKSLRSINRHQLAPGLPLVDIETALIRAGAFIAWATQENRRLVRERNEAIEDRHKLRVGGRVP